MKEKDIVVCINDDNHTYRGLLVKGSKYRIECVSDDTISVIPCFNDGTPVTCMPAIFYKKVYFELFEQETLRSIVAMPIDSDESRAYKFFTAPRYDCCICGAPKNKCNYHSDK